MEEKEISSAEESIQIIEAMINRAKTSAADNSFLFLLWGWLILIASVTQFILKALFNYPHHYYTWALLFVALIISVFRDKSKIPDGRSKSYVDYAVGNLWMGIISSYILLTIIFFRIGWEHCYTFYILLMSLGCFLTGKIVNFYPLMAGSIICCLLALLTTFIDFDDSILICGIAILVSYIIPGHLLRTKFKKTQIR
jgi:hypothetical protein